MRTIHNEKNQIIAIIGDGALTGGLAYEGINNLGYHRTQLTIILNDNSFSISESVGALSKYLTKITTSQYHSHGYQDIPRQPRNACSSSPDSKISYSHVG